MSFVVNGEGFVSLEEIKSDMRGETDSLHRVQLLDCLHECTDTNLVARDTHELPRTVVHRVEFTNLVAETDSLEKDADVFSRAGLLEVELGYAELREGRGEQ
jgi:hypothetical protein